MEKIDLFKEFKSEYKAKLTPELIETSPSQYLAIEGKGTPGGSEFEQALGALYSMAFTIKMTRKFAGLGDYVVCKLESQWWCDNGCFTTDNMENWQWRMLIRTPDCVGLSDLEQAAEVIISKKKATGVEKVFLHNLDEGQCVQILHVGPYEAEWQTINIMHEYIKQNNLQVNGLHHEIYLSDPRRVAPEKLKTILRQPIKE